MSEFWFAFTLGFSTACAGGWLLWQLWTGDMDETPDERERMEARLRTLDAIPDPADGWISERFPLPMRPRARRAR